MPDVEGLVPDPDEQERLLVDSDGEAEACDGDGDGDGNSSVSPDVELSPKCHKEDDNASRPFAAPPSEGEPLLATQTSDFNQSASSGSVSRPDYSKPVRHYHSISVHLHVPNAPKPRPGALSLVEVDAGGADDLFSIDVTMHWKSHARELPASPATASPIAVSVDELLALRIVLNANPHPRVTLHARGGVRIASFGFPNGRDAAMSFITALRAHVDTMTVVDREAPGELFMLEAKPRMRRVAPVIGDGMDFDSGSPGVMNSDHGDPSGEMDTTGMLGRPSGARRYRARANVHDPDSALRADPGMAVLETFARVTQLARDVGDDFQWLFSEKRRQEDAARRERERLARERALDIYADLAWPGSEAEDENRQLPPRLVLEKPRGVPLSEEGWQTAFGEDGTLFDPAVVRMAIFAGGVHPELRSKVWPFLLNVFGWNSSGSERDAITQRNIDRYAELKAHWLDLKSDATTEDSISKAKAVEAAMMAAIAAAEKDGTPVPDPADLRIPDRMARVGKRHASYLATDEQILKDIVRTDRKVDVYVQDDSRLTSMMGDILNVYAVYNPSIGYCQGMSDYLSPILSVFGEHDEALTFWCFEGLMQLYQSHFRVDQSGMNTLLASAKALLKACDGELFAYFQDTDPDMYCIFRWMLVCFKRELPFDATPRLWEILWTRQICEENLHVYVAIALLRAHRRNLLKLERGGFDLLLRYVNDMSQRIDVDFAVRQAEMLCKMSY